MNCFSPIIKQLINVITAYKLKLERSLLRSVFIANDDTHVKLNKVQITKRKHSRCILARDAI